MKNNLDSPVLIIMARWAAPGRCKRRLASAIGEIKAAEVQEKMNLHTIQVAKDLEKKGLAYPILAISGVGNKKASKWSKQLGINNINKQGQGSLGLRMRKQFLIAQRRINDQRQSNRKIIIIGTDLPSLCTNDLNEALQALEENSFVFGPSVDGGYWLIGFSREMISPMTYWPFIGISWGTNKVLSQTIKQATLRNIKYKSISMKNDIDVINDLREWH